jgi:hypothetical protein
MFISVRNKQSCNTYQKNTNNSKKKKAELDQLKPRFQNQKGYGQVAGRKVKASFRRFTFNMEASR